MPVRLACLLVLAFVSGLRVTAAPVLTEFVAATAAGLADADGEFQDWIEIHNPGAAAVSLAGYHLTDDLAQPRKWTFPAVVLEPGGYRVVFASGKNRVDPAGELHTGFQLSAAGESLALIAPNGSEVVSGFLPVYPPQFEGESFGLDPASATPVWMYYRTPTPGARNGAGTRAGPRVQALEPNPAAPEAGPWRVAVRVLPTNDPVGTVRVYYRRMFVGETALALADDGQGADEQAGDGVWSGWIPATAFVPGEMTRWRFVATDVRGTETQEPAFRVPSDADRYFGTVTRDAGIRSELPVLHWFTTNTTAAGTLSGSRGAVYYLGEFYDNVLFTLHGQSSASFPKKSYNLDFNRGHRFLWSTNAPRVADIDLLTNWADKSKARHVLAYEVMRESGVAAHFAFTVRVEQNGSFFSTADLVEDADEIYLERAGLNPEGALYKMYANTLNKGIGDTGTRGVEKKTRRGENNADLQGLIDGLALTGAALERYLFDHLDIPACVNLVAANSVIRNIDMHGKNWYAYRDTGRSGEWSILPWDLDLSFGRVWNEANTYFDNALYFDGYVVNSTAIRLIERLFANPKTRPMIFRRIRTLSDRFLQPPPVAGASAGELYLERRLDEISALIDPPGIVPSDARLDFEKWGSWLQGGTVVKSTNTSAAVETMAEGIERWKVEYLPKRRAYIYNTQVVGRGGEIPLPQNTTPAATNFVALVGPSVAVRALVPVSGNFGYDWTGDPAREPYSVGSWLSGRSGVGYERATGYESLIGLDVGIPMQRNNSVFVRVEFQVADPAAFDRLELRMKYDDGFVAFLNGVRIAAANAPSPLAWNSAATVSREANPAAFTVFDVSENRGALRTGRNILAVQGLNDSLTSSDLIIVPELHGGRFVAETLREPQLRFGALESRPASGNQDEEYIQLINPSSIAVDVSGWRVTGGVEHTFAAGTVLPPGGGLYLSPNVAAFRARAVSPRGGEGHWVQGGYRGHLSNQGETLVILDASGATNAVLAYPPNPTDAQRFLVVSELLFHPAGDAGAEYVELLNTSDSVTLDLTGVRFTRGVDFDFTGSAVTSLAPGARVLVVRDALAVATAFGPGLPIAGSFANGSALNNGGERIKLEDAEDGTIAEFSYLPGAPWPEGTASGFALVLRDAGTRPDPADPTHWRISAVVGGTPGLGDVVPFPADPTADSDGNGQADLWDYVFGGGPGSMPPPLRITRVDSGAGGEPGLAVQYLVRPGAERLEVRLDHSTDLLRWEEVTADSSASGWEALGDGRVRVTRHLTEPWRDSVGGFLRLRLVPVE